MITGTEPSPVVSLKASYNARYVWAISLVAAMGGLLFGYDWVVIGGARQFFEPYFQISELKAAEQPAAGQSLTPAQFKEESFGREHARAWANSCALVGCLAGALLAGAISDWLGRKRLLVFAALLFALTSVGNGLAPDYPMFIRWRILGGVAIGLASGLSPMYIAEIAPAQVRGRLVAINQLTIVVGILLAQFVNWGLGYGLPAGASDADIVNSWYGQTCWRLMFALTAVPAVLFLLGMLCVPESPRWLARKGQTDRSFAVLRRIGGDAYANAALADIEATLATEAQKAGLGVRFKDGLEALLSPRMFKVLLLGVVLAVFQQWCGINVIFNYAGDIFRDAGYDISAVLKNIAWTGSVNLAFTFVALGVVDRGGRRPLMLLGAAGLAVIYVVMGACYYQHVTGWPMLLLVLAAIACYSCSLAPVVWVVISEIFPNRIRGAAMSVSVSALWVACFVLTYTFPILRDRLGPAKTFWTYGAICVVGFFFILALLPETKGKTLEEIEAALVGGSGSEEKK